MEFPVAWTLMWRFWFERAAAAQCANRCEGGFNPYRAISTGALRGASLF